MAHSCRWRFPARPGGSSNLGTGRRAGRIRVTASLRSGTGTHPNTAGLGPGFDAALQVSSAIGCNLQTFRDVLGESSGSSSGEVITPTQEKKPRGRPPRALTAQRGGAGPSPSSVLEKPEDQERLAEKAKRLPGRPPGSGEKRRGRPPASVTQRSWEARSHAANNNDSRQPLKASRVSKVTKLKRLREVKLSPLKSRLKAIARKCLPVSGVPRRRRGRPPSAERRKDDDSPDVHSSSPPSSPLAESSPSKLGRPLNLRTSPRHVNPVRIVPPSKRTDATIAKQLLQRAKKGAQKKKLLEKEAVAIESQGGAGMEAGIRKRRRTQLKNIRQFIMPVVSTVSLRIIKTPKRFIEDEGSFGAPHPHMKMARFDAVPHPVAAPQPALASSPMRASTAAVATAAATAVTAAPVDTIPPPATIAASSATAVAASLLNNRCNNGTSNGRFSSSAASCGSSAMSQHSSQLSSGESSRSSSPSLDDSSCDSQASEGTQALSERDHSPSSQGEREGDLLHTSRPLSEPEPEQRVLIERGRRGRRGQGVGRGSLGARGRGSLATGGKKAIISPATGVLMNNSQQAASTASSSPPPPPLLSPPLQAQSGSITAEHHPHSPWILPHPFRQGPSLVLSSLQDKRRSILREPTFRWTSRSRTEQQYFSSAKYAKEGLIRKPIFDNFRPPPLTAQDVGLMPHGAGGVAPAGYPAPGGGSGAGTRLFSPLHHHHHHQQHPSSRFESPLQKRSPLLRAPRFTPSEAHSRIFESVTLQSSSGSSPGSLSPLQSSPKSGRSVRRRRRKTLGPLRGQPRSPSHSMTTRSSQPGAPSGKAPSELCLLTGSVSTGASSTCSSSSSLPTSALTPAPFTTFSPGSLGLSSHGPSSSDGHRAAGSLGGGTGGNSASSSSSQLFPLFTSSPQETGRGAGKGGRERSTSVSRDSAPVKELERETEKSREREKENKREGRKDWERRGKASTPDASPNTTPSLFAVEGRDGEESLTSVAPKKTPGRKKSVSVDSGTEAAPVERAAVHSSIPPILTKGRASKKTRPSERGPEAEPGEKEKTSAPAQQTGLPLGQTGSKKPPAVPSLGSMLAHAEKLPVADKRVAGLLKKAKAQLFKIEKSKSLKSPDHPKVQSQESDSSETSVRGPRIKHVCRRAAVALGRNRAVFPDDMPTLSALPWEEREKILSSMGNDDKSSVAGSEEAEPQSPPIKPVMRHTKTIQEGGAVPRKGRRSRRCGQCPGCQVPEDCGVCTNCLDKPKFGGRNIKKQCCKVRKCQNLQWMPSKIFLQKQGKGQCKKDKKNKLSEKKEALHPVKDPTSAEPSLKPAPPPLKEEPPHKKSETPPPKPGEEKHKLPQLQSPPERKPQQPTPPSSPFSSSPQSSPSPPTPQPPQQRPQPTQGPPKKEGAGAPKSPPTEAKGKPQQQSTKPETSTLNLLSTPSTGGTAKQKVPSDGVHRIRVDFKKDHDVENVWATGGLSLLTSVPITPRVVCFLCASSGNVEFVFCQVCCEPFHLFCLGETERPLEEQWEDWCCRRCRFCHTCGLQHQKTKQLLECEKCRNSYHPECLGPNHPTRPTKKKRVWICTKCVRCKSCGATKPGKAWDAQWSHDFSRCHDCAKLFAKGNFCPLCDKCYDDDDYDSKMMQCGRCDHWVHSKCENLTDEMYELLSNLPESVAYTCTSCTKCQPAEWRTALEKELQGLVRRVLTALLNSRTSTHLLRYRQAVMKPPELNPETESLPTRRSPEGPDPPVLTEVAPPNDSPLDLESVEKKLDAGRYKSVLEFSDDIVKIIQTAINSDGGLLENRKANSMVKSFFIRQMERVFPWFKVKESRFWETHKFSTNSGLLPNAVLPPSLDHNYAQWQEREEIARAEQPLRKKIIPAPCSKTHVEPDSPTSPPPLRPLLPPPLPMLHDLSREDSPELLPPPGVSDNRQCVLCLKYGDDHINEGGRLLYIGQNEWTHVNCALWSAEVFEDDDGSLKNVHMAVIRGKQLRCENCQRPGATVGCCLTSCTRNYHFMCARQRHCVFLEDKKVYCQRHRDLIKGEVVSESGFEVTRRILVDLEGISLRRKFLTGLQPENIHMMIGSMTIDCLGMLTELSDCERKLFPVGYQCSRVYWSTLDARKRCVYTCRILVCRPSVVEPDLKSALPEENRTISHSPLTPISGVSQNAESLPPLHPEDCVEKRLLAHCTEDEGTSDRDDHALLEEEGGDRDKHHEDDSDCAGSTKRRYPRRSARARSNMFFGLTPFYGVRSYGEQDIPFYSSSGDGPGKRKAGGSRRSAEGQVDGADDRSTSSGDSGEEEEGGFSHLLGHQQIGQLDGVDDSSESDASANTTTTATVATSSHKSTGKRKGRERHTEKLEHDSGKEADNGSGGGGSSGSSSNNIREGRKSQKDNSLPLGGVKSSQGQDPLEAQLSLNTDLKSDSDNNNSDDCGNILPSDIMEFVLNTPSMQALGQQPEAASSELLSLDGGYGVGVNRRKDILFEDFPQPLASTEPVESRVNTSISVEEPYGLPLELPSDLSVLTTRSPTVNNQNHGGLISEGSECTMLSLAASDETITEKGGEDKQQKGGAGMSPESQQEGSGGSRESQVRGGHMTPVQFEHITSPSLGEVVEAGNKDLTRSSGTPVLPSSPTLPLQGQKYIPPPSSVSPRPSHVASTAVQTTSHLKPGPEKLIVINQHLQPLYVLQTLPNGVTQKIQITPSSSATGVMDTMTLTTGLTTGITTSQPIFPAGGKVLGTMPNHPQIHTFTGTTQTGFQPGIPSTTSGLLIGLPSHEPQILVTEAGRSASISTSSAVPASGHGKKRPISRLQPRKTKKLARSRSQPTLGPSEVRPNMTLINLSSPQMAQSELGTLTTAATTSHRKVPNIIKRPKSGVMYFEPIQQRMPLPSGQPGILGHASSTHLLPCTVSGLNPNQSAVLNMVSMAQPSGPGGLITPGSVSLSTPVLSSPEITGPISSLLFKASPHNLLQSGAPLMSQLCSPAQTSIASSICVLPSHQTISMSVRQQVDPESGVFQRQQHPPNASGQHVAPAPSPVQQDSDKGHLVGVLSQSSSSQSSHTMPKSRSSSEQKQELTCSAAVTASTCSGKGKQKAKRTRQSPDKASGKKHKGWLAEPPREMQGDQPTSVPGPWTQASPERGAPSAEPPSLTSKTSEFPEEKSETTAGSLLVASPDQEGSRRDSSMDSKPKKGLIFEICSDDGFQIRCESIEEAWKSLTDKVQEARSNARLKELSFEGVNGLRMLGVLHDAVVFLLEQLYGSRHCRNYRFRFHKPEEADEPPINPHGSARAELNHRRSVFDMFNFLASKHRQPPEYNPHEEDEEVQLKSARRATSMDLPMPMRFRHLKRTSKEAVGVYRSAIHGRGLFCKRSIDVGEMVIEYSGNVIRSVLTDKREKYYDGKGVGCYMFRIDDYEVVDATVHGNAARFINHSCEPNCYSRVINVDGQKHIVIFATRKIYRGEELTYDYKFPIEEPGNKLPCNCGTKKCRKFLN
uniref:Histone-lysine N-methyltransferase n=1 Tax=Oncorhynchus mykiss TaxID=8022 RepID=A0A8C7TX02_ONCMY